LLRVTLQICKITAASALNAITSMQEKLRITTKLGSNARK